MRAIDTCARLPGEFFLLNRVDAVMAGTVVRSMELSAFEGESGVRAGFPKHMITGEFPAARILALTTYKGDADPAPQRPDHGHPHGAAGRARHSDRRRGPPSFRSGAT
jgi:hypothetical protein